MSNFGCKSNVFYIFPTDKFLKESNCYDTMFRKYLLNKKIRDERNQQKKKNKHPYKQNNSRFKKISENTFLNNKSNTNTAKKQSFSSVAQQDVFFGAVDLVQLAYDARVHSNIVEKCLIGCYSKQNKNQIYYITVLSSYRLQSTSHKPTQTQRREIRIDQIIGENIRLKIVSNNNRKKKTIANCRYEFR